jgi:hypothetical protein
MKNAVCYRIRFRRKVSPVKGRFRGVFKCKSTFESLALSNYVQNPPKSPFDKGDFEKYF